MLAEELKKLSNLSEDLGKNLNLIQGAGGNTSVKIDGMLHCLANTLLRVQPNEKLSYLSEQDELELLDWNAEEYRQSIQKKRV